MRWIGVLAVLVMASLSSGCIPIGVRAGTMPLASAARSFDHGRQIAEATDEHHRDAG